MDWLDDLMQAMSGKTNSRSSSEQLARAQEQMRKNPATKEQEAMARREGFASHAAMIAYMRQREARGGGTKSGSSGPKKAPAGLKTAMGFHPAVTLGEVEKALSSANKRNR